MLRTLLAQAQCTPQRRWRCVHCWRKFKAQPWGGRAPPRSVAEGAGRYRSSLGHESDRTSPWKRFTFTHQACLGSRQVGARWKLQATSFWLWELINVLHHKIAVSQKLIRRYITRRCSARNLLTLQYNTALSDEFIRNDLYIYIYAVFSSLLGSTVDTYYQSTEALWDFTHCGEGGPRILLLRSTPSCPRS